MKLVRYYQHPPGIRYCAKLFMGQEPSKKPTEYACTRRLGHDGPCAWVGASNNYFFGEYQEYWEVEGEP